MPYQPSYISPYNTGVDVEKTDGNLFTCKIDPYDTITEFKLYFYEVSTNNLVGFIKECIEIVPTVIGGETVNVPKQFKYISNMEYYEKKEVVNEENDSLLPLTGGSSLRVLVPKTIERVDTHEVDGEIVHYVENFLENQENYKWIIELTDDKNNTFIVDAKVKSVNYDANFYIVRNDGIISSSESINLGKRLYGGVDFYSKLGIKQNIVIGKNSYEICDLKKVQEEGDVKSIILPSDPGYLPYQDNDGETIKVTYVTIKTTQNLLNLVKNFSMQNIDGVTRFVDGELDYTQLKLSISDVDTYEVLSCGEVIRNTEYLIIVKGDVGTHYGLIDGTRTTYNFYRSVNIAAVDMGETTYPKGTFYKVMSNSLKSFEYFFQGVATPHIDLYNYGEENDPSKIIDDGFIEDYARADLFLIGIYNEEIAYYKWKLELQDDLSFAYETVEETRDIFSSQILYKYQGLMKDRIYRVTVKVTNIYNVAIEKSIRFRVVYGTYITNSKGLVTADCDRKAIKIDTSAYKSAAGSPSKMENECFYQKILSTIIEQVERENNNVYLTLIPTFQSTGDTVITIEDFMNEYYISYTDDFDTLEGYIRFYVEGLLHYTKKNKNYKIVNIIDNVITLTNVDEDSFAVNDSLDIIIKQENTDAIPTTVIKTGNESVKWGFNTIDSEIYVDSNCATIFRLKCENYPKQLQKIFRMIATDGDETFVEIDPKNIPSEITDVNSEDIKKTVLNIKEWGNNVVSSIDIYDEISQYKQFHENNGCIVNIGAEYLIDFSVSLEDDIDINEFNFVNQDSYFITNDITTKDWLNIVVYNNICVISRDLGKNNDSGIETLYSSLGNEVKLTAFEKIEVFPNIELELMECSIFDKSNQEDIDNLVQEDIGDLTQENIDNINISLRAGLVGNPSYEDVIDSEVKGVYSLAGGNPYEWSGKTIFLATFVDGYTSASPGYVSIKTAKGFAYYRNYYDKNLNMIGSVYFARTNRDCKILYDYSISQGDTYSYIVYPIYGDLGTSNEYFGQPIETQKIKPMWYTLNLYGTIKDDKIDSEDVLYWGKETRSYLVDKKNLWEFAFNLEKNSIQITTDKTLFEGMSRYPRIGKGLKDYRSGSISGLLGKVGYHQVDKYYTNGEEVFNFGYQDTIKQADDLRVFCNNDEIKLLRDRRGNLIPVDLTLESLDYDMDTNPATIRFTIKWTEVRAPENFFVYEMVETEN